jgi:uncharacterized protein YjbI with pentapeptide repeats
MADPQQLDILKKGARSWNQWRSANPQLVNPIRDHRFGSFPVGPADATSGLDLRGAWLNGEDLRDADFSGTDLRSANLIGADLSKANLSGADLREAHLNYVNLNGADLRSADLRLSDLRGAVLDGADVTFAVFLNTVVGDLDLSQTKGLIQVMHQGPSTIGIDTIYRSKGEIPEAFLRGAGVPDNFITFARSLIGQAIEFYSCFISYSTQDQRFADRLYADLQAKGVRCWFAPEDVRGGKKLHEQIDEAIRVHDKLLLVLSDASMNSEWVATEIAKARRRERREDRRMLFPISLVPFDRIREWESFDADTGKDSAREVREYFIPDFSTWKDHDSYQKALHRVLRDLASGPAKPVS